ncbi:MAG: hypothetical protein MUF42_03560 [Cytophagaceae bacterium]|jgi:hypothetical protein|nr:hypothetical protein [Cytophagaceae bacterium]
MKTMTVLFFFSALSLIACRRKDDPLEEIKAKQTILYHVNANNSSLVKSVTYRNANNELVSSYNTKDLSVEFTTENHINPYLHVEGIIHQGSIESTVESSSTDPSLQFYKRQKHEAYISGGYQSVTYTLEP